MYFFILFQKASQKCKVIEGSSKKYLCDTYSLAILEIFTFVTEGFEEKPVRAGDCTLGHGKMHFPDYPPAVSQG